MTVFGKAIFPRELLDSAPRWSSNLPTDGAHRALLDFHHKHISTVPRLPNVA